MRFLRNGNWITREQLLEMQAEKEVKIVEVKRKPKRKTKKK